MSKMALSCSLKMFLIIFICLPRGSSSINPHPASLLDHSYFTLSDAGFNIPTAEENKMNSSEHHIGNNIKLSNLVLEEIGPASFDEAMNFDHLIQNYEAMDIEVGRQDMYLHRFGLRRIPIIGDGNCLFRAISFSIYGNQDNHIFLRNLAAETLRANIEEFSDYFLADRGTPLEQIQQLSIPGTYAGQECIYALAKALNINILVTLGGDDNSREIITMDNSFSSDRLYQNSAHIIWRRIGGGHYEAIGNIEDNIEVSGHQMYPNLNINQNNQHTQPFKTSNSFTQEINLATVSQIKHQKTNTQSNVVLSPHISKDSLMDFHKYSKTKQDYTQKKYMCADCKLVFSNFNCLHKHKATHKNKCQKQKQKLHVCKVSTCNLHFRTSEQLIQHEIKAHDANINIDNLVFDNDTQFKRFKEKEEMSKNTRFVMRNKIQQNRKKEKTYIMECHRNGYIKTHKKKGHQNKLLRRNIKGNCQLNEMCPARICVREKPDGKIHVKYIKSHSHSLNFEQTKFLPIPNKIKNEILGMLSLKIPIGSIITKVREQFSNRDHRDNMEDVKYYNLIDRKTIHNLKQKLADPEIIQDSNDAISTYIKVQMLRKEKYNPVLIFKQQDTENDFSITPGLEKQDFLLAFMTKQQLNIYQQFANRILCMDSTHKTNTYSFKLITLLVPDQFRKGYPVAFCISNREDEVAIRLFLESVKSKSPNTKVNILMTDDDNAGWNAARSVFGNDLKHFLCTWHVYRSWTRNVQQHFKDDEQKSTVFSFLCAMLEAKSENEFNQYKSALINKLQKMNPNFLQYLENHYFARSEKWAKCFRKGDYCNVDTNMFVESFHNQLKTVYFEGKRNKRIDVLLETLLRLENNLFINHFKRLSYNIPSNGDTHTQDRHERSLQINNKYVKQISDVLYSVDSLNSQYIIEIKNRYCDNEHCYIKCKDIPCIDLCYHLYKCNCPDYDKGFICKHIHKVHCIYTSYEQDNFESEQNELLVVNPEKDSLVSQNSSSDIDSQYEKVKSLLIKLEQQINNPRVKEMRMPVIFSTLQTIIAGNDACINMPVPIGNLKETEKVPGNAKNILQPRFHKTEKKKGRTKKAHIHKPTQQEKEQLLDSSNQATDDSRPSVAPYPPLRLVPRSTPFNDIHRSPEQPLLSVNGEIGVPSGLRIPPSMIGNRISVPTKDGKKQVIIFTNGIDQKENELML